MAKPTRNKTTRRKGNLASARTASSSVRKPATSANQNTKDLRIQALFFVLLAFLLYANTLSHQFAFDDALVITENQYTRQGLAGIPKLVSTDFFTGIYGEKGMELTGGRYRPLSLVMFAAENQFFGTGNPGPDGTLYYSYNAFAGHLLNVLFYAISCGLLFLLLLRWFPEKPVIAWICTLLFTVHPVHTEVVANIKSRDEIMALFFLFLSLLLLGRNLKKSNSFVLIAGASLCFFLAMLSKENAFTYVGVLPIVLWTVYRLKGIEVLRASAPFWITALTYILLRSAMVGLPSTAETNPSILENPFVASSSGEKLGTIFSILLRYLGLLVYPAKLACDYSFAQIAYVLPGNPTALFSLLIHAALFALLLQTLRKRDPLALCIAAYLFPLSVASNLVFNIGAPMGERFIYMSSLGFLLAVPLLISKYSGWKIPGQWKSKPVLSGAILLIGILFSVKTLARNPEWMDNESLFKADVQTHPKSAKLQYYYANTMLKKQMADETNPALKPLLDTALVHFKRSVEIYPDFQLSWYNVALTLVQQEKGKEALPYLERALALNPNHPISHALLGQVYGRYLNEPRRALRPLLRCINEFGMSEAGILQNAGICYAMLGQADSALMYLDRALIQNPDDQALLQNKINVLLQSGRMEEAEKLRQQRGAAVQ